MATSDQLRNAVTGNTAVAKQQATTFPHMLQLYKSQIAAALPRHINADRMARIALTCYRNTPKLAECDPASVFAAVIQSSQLGLEPGLNGRAYIVPYYNNKKKQMEAQFIPGWKGLVELANRTGRCAVWTGAVFAGDTFDYSLGDRPRIDHKPGDEDDPEKLIHTYAVGRVQNNEWPICEIWTVGKIRKHRDRYNKVDKSHYSFSNWEMYARKVPLLQVLKYMPSSPELEAAIALNDAAEVGASQELNITDAIAGTFTAAPESTGNGQADGNGKDQPAGGGGGGPTLVDILNMVTNTLTPDTLTEAEDLARSLVDEKERAEVDVAVRKRRKDLQATDKT